MRRQPNVIPLRFLVSLLVSVFVHAFYCAILLADAETGWGDLTGRFVCTDLPMSPPVAGKESGRKIADESLLVDPQNYGIANVAIWLFTDRNAPPSEIDPQAAEMDESAATVTITESGLRPRLTFARPGQRTRFQSQVDYGTNIILRGVRNSPSNRLVNAKGHIETQWTEAETIPVFVTSSVHPWQRAFVIVKSHPYAAISDHDGRFVIKNLPIGVHTFQLWHERSGYVMQVERDGQSLYWLGGKFQHAVKAGDNDLGEIRVAPTVFKK